MCSGIFKNIEKAPTTNQNNIPVCQYLYLFNHGVHFFSYTIKDIVKENPVKENSTIDFNLNKVNVLLCAFWEQK